MRRWRDDAHLDGLRSRSGPAGVQCTPPSVVRKSVPSLPRPETTAQPTRRDVKSIFLIRASGERFRRTILCQLLPASCVTKRIRREAQTQKLGEAALRGAGTPTPAGTGVPLQLRPPSRLR